MSVVFGTKEVKIRKACHCYGCGDRQEKGAKIHVTKGVQDGRFWSSYWCPICWDFQDRKDYFFWQHYMDDGLIYEDCFKEDDVYKVFREKWLKDRGFIDLKPVK